LDGVTVSVKRHAAFFNHNSITIADNVTRQRVEIPVLLNGCCRRVNASIRVNVDYPVPRFDLRDSGH
jgi:hypothetical protein